MLNRINESKDGKTANELMTQQRPNVAHLRVIGSPAWVYIERHNGKLSDKAIKKCLLAMRQARRHTWS
jgi:hypothetical protein